MINVLQYFSRFRRIKATSWAAAAAVIFRARCSLFPLLSDAFSDLSTLSSFHVPCLCSCPLLFSCGVAIYLKEFFVIVSLVVPFHLGSSCVELHFCKYCLNNSRGFAFAFLFNHIITCRWP